MSFTSNKQVLTYIHETLGDVEIKDATFKLRIQPLPVDAEGANPKDPFNCFYVHTIKRMYGCKIVVIWKTVAYLDMVDTDGIRRVYRFMISQETISRTAAFDRGEAFPMGAAIELLPPNDSNKLKNKKQYRHQRQQKRKVAVDQARAAIKKAKQDLAKANMQKTMANEAKDAKKVAAITKRIAVKQEVLKKAQAKISSLKVKTRVATKFDLTTRNGAIGNYNFGL
jgi:hypothetical protein